VRRGHPHADAADLRRGREPGRQGQAWDTALTIARVDHKLVSVEGADHLFSSSQAQQRIRQEIIDWFERTRPSRQWE
jgi:dipeptidyl aminopeptidase/acylaminoacyl peptidase